MPTPTLAELREKLLEYNHFQAHSALSDFMQHAARIATTVNEPSKWQTAGKIVANETSYPQGRRIDSYTMHKLLEGVRGMTLEEIESRLQGIHEIDGAQDYPPHSIIRQISIVANHPRFLELYRKLAAIHEEIEGMRPEAGTFTNRTTADRDNLLDADINDRHSYNGLIRTFGININEKGDMLDRAVRAWRAIHVAAHNNFGPNYSDGEYEYYGKGVATALIPYALHPRIEAIAEKAARYAKDAHGLNELPIPANLLSASLAHFCKDESTEKSFDEFSQAYPQITESITQHEKETLANSLTHVLGSINHGNHWQDHVETLKQIFNAHDKLLAAKVVENYPLFLARVPAEELHRNLKNISLSQPKEADALDIEGVRKAKDGISEGYASTGVYWSGQKIDYLNQLISQSKSQKLGWDNKKLAVELNKQFPGVSIPAIALLPALSIAHDETTVTMLQRLFAKKEIKDTTQHQMKIAGMLANLASFQQSELEEHGKPVLQKLLELTEGVSGKKKPVKEMADVLGACSMLFSHNEPGTLRELNQELSRVTSLKELIPVIATKTTKVLANRLGITPELIAEHKITNERMLEWAGSPHYGIIATLTQQYRNKNPAAVPVLANISLRLMKGAKKEFYAWREENEVGKAQLETIFGDEEKLKQNWLADQSKTVGVRSVSKSEFLMGRQSSAMRAIKEATQHAEFEGGQLVAEPQQLAALDSRIASLRTKPDAPAQEVTRLEKARNIIANLIELRERVGAGPAEIQLLDNDTEHSKQIIELQKNIRKDFTDLGLNESADDILRLQEAFKTTFKEKSGGTFKVSDTKDPDILFQIGETPVHSCQSYVNGGFNHCLLAYVADANKKAIVLHDEQNNLVARSIIKMANAQIDGKEERVLLMEPFYAKVHNQEYLQAMLEHGLKKASASGALAVATRDVDAFTRAAEKLGMHVETKEFTIQMPPSLNKWEYSDSYGVRDNANLGYSLTIKAHVALPNPGVSKTWAIENPRMHSFFA